MGFEATFSRRIEKELAQFPGEKASASRSNKSVALRVHTENSKAANSSSKSKKNRKRSKKMAVTPIQRLFDTCKEVFADGGPGIVPSEEKIERLRAVLDEIRPEDVGLNPQMPYFRTITTRRTPPITYLHLHECDKFSMGIFCLPPSGVIPLHNHPGMTVFSKLLFGTMHIKSYDWAGVDTHAQPPEVRLAKLKVDSDFTAPCNTSILYPADGGNMHRFTAQTACAVLDVLGPPYCDPEGRHCTYYFDFPFSTYSAEGLSVPEEERDGYAWLKEREDNPEDLNVTGAQYRGPRIVGN